MQHRAKSLDPDWLDLIDFEDINVGASMCSAKATTIPAEHDVTEMYQNANNAFDLPLLMPISTRSPPKERPDDGHFAGLKHRGLELMLTGF